MHWVILDLSFIDIWVCESSPQSGCRMSWKRRQNSPELTPRLTDFFRESNSTNYRNDQCMGLVGNLLYSMQQERVLPRVWRCGKVVEESERRKRILIIFRSVQDLYDGMKILHTFDLWLLTECVRYLDMCGKPHLCTVRTTNHCTLRQFVEKVLTITGFKTSKNRRSPCFCKII